MAAQSRPRYPSVRRGLVASDWPLRCSPRGRASPPTQVPPTEAVAAPLIFYLDI
jgi:hypothetical protein